jgi:hypothetical protein
MLLDTILLLLLAIVVVAFVLHPLWIASRGVTAPAWSAELLDLFAERDAILAMLRDLQLDYETGKVSESDYRVLRQSLLTHAARLLRAIERAESSEEVDIDREIERLRELVRQLDTGSSRRTVGASP